MGIEDPSGQIWREERATSVSAARWAESLGRLVDEDHDPAETAYYEALSDSEVLALDDAQRSHAAQHLRHAKRRRLRQRRDKGSRRGDSNP